MSEVKCNTCKGVGRIEFEQGQRYAQCLTCSGSGIDWRKTCDAQRLRADTAEAELKELEGAVVWALPGTRFMDPPDGGSPTLGEQVGRMAEALTTAEQHIAELAELLNFAAHYLEESSFNSVGDVIEHTQEMRDEFREKIVTALNPNAEILPATDYTCWLQPQEPQCIDCPNRNQIPEEESHE